MKGRVGLGIVLAVVCVVVLPTLARGEAVDFRDDFADASKVGASSGILYVLGAVTLPPVFPARNGVVLPRGTGGDVDASGVVPGSVLFEGGLYKIWYGACCGGGASSIAYATSTDGIAWTKQGAVVTPSLPAEAAGISYVEVVKVGATYWMWYAGLDGTYYRILAATSADGIAWTKRGVVLDVGAPGSSDDRYLWRPSAVYDGSNFRLWYTGNSFSNQANRIFYATSPDGLNWTKRGIAIPSGWQPPNDSAQTAMPEVRLVAHDRHRAAGVPVREPAHDAVHARPGCQVGHPFHAQPAERGRDDLGGLDRALVRARRQHVQLGNELLQAERGALHLAASVGREGPGSVVFVRARECLAILGDGVPDDEEAHRTKGSGGRRLALGSAR